MYYGKLKNKMSRFIDTSHKPVLTSTVAPIGSGGTISAAQNWSTITSTPNLPTIHSIQGKMFQVDMTVSDLDTMNNFDPQKIKVQLVHSLAQKLYESEYISFTKQSDHLTGNTHYRARIYVTPDEMTRLIQSLSTNNR